MSERRSSNVAMTRKPRCKSSKRGCCGFLSLLCSKEKKADDKDEYKMDTYEQHSNTVREHSGDPKNENGNSKTPHNSPSPTGNSPVRPSFSKSETISPEEQSISNKSTEEETGGNETTESSKKNGKARERPLIAVLTTAVPHVGSSRRASVRVARARIDITRIQNDWDKFCSVAKEKLRKENLGYAGQMPSDLKFTCLTINSLHVRHRDSNVNQSEHVLTRETFLGALQQYSYIKGNVQEVVVDVQQALPDE
ncbi:MAG: hypothetical protein Q9183_005167 [Haloplaca sp. 2 TL-2023]